MDLTGTDIHSIIGLNDKPYVFLRDTHLIYLMNTETFKVLPLIECDHEKYPLPYSVQYYQEGEGKSKVLIVGWDSHNKQRKLLQY